MEFLGEPGLQFVTSEFYFGIVTGSTIDNRGGSFLQG